MATPGPRRPMDLESISEIKGSRAGRGNDSLKSFSSEHSLTEHGNFLELLTYLLETERRRVKAVAGIDQARQRLKLLRCDMMTATAQQTHVARRQALVHMPDSIHGNDNARLAARFASMLETAIEDQEAVLSQLSLVQTEYESACQELHEGEPRLFRATQGFPRRVRRDSTDELVVTREYAQAIRFAADFGQVFLRQSREHAWIRPGQQTLPVAKGCDKPELLDWYLQTMLEHNFREKMSRMYRTMEPLLVELGVIQLEEDSEAEEQSVRKHNLGLAQGSADKLRFHLASARRQVYDAHHWLLIGLKDTYQTGRDKFLMTYAAELGPANDSHASPADAYDREYMRKFQEANKAVTRADAEYIRLRNQALEDRVADPGETDLLGILDHAEDAFTDSEKSLARKDRKFASAARAPGIHAWLRTAHGGGYREKQPPSEIAAVDSGSSARSVPSEGSHVDHHDLVDRWQAELVVVRKDLERQIQQLDPNTKPRHSRW